MLSLIGTGGVVEAKPLHTSPDLDCTPTSGIPYVSGSSSPSGVVPKSTLRNALEIPELLGNAIPGDSWKAWRALLLAIMGEPLRPDELELFQQLTERQDPPTTRVSEVYGIVGRRGGKSRPLATLLNYLATLVDYRAKLASGEIPVVLCLSPSQEQSGIILSYTKGILQESPVLAQLVVRETAEQVELSNRVTINVRAASFRRLRGQTCVAA